MKRSLIGLLALISALFSIAQAHAATPATPTAWDPASFNSSYRLQQIFSGLSNPVGIVDPGDGSGRLFIIEQTGTIRVVVDGSLRKTPFLDISSLITTSGNEQGLLGLAFDPKFKTNGRFYVDYTDVDGNTVVARYTLSNSTHNQADPSTAETILTQKQPYPNHNCGDIVFGPDGDLYICFGDGGSEGDPNRTGQNMQTWLGKILRIDVSGDGAYTIPKDNPYADGKNALPEIFISGVRNPWRFSFDMKTGDLYIGDVGQDEYEEIDYLPAGHQAGVNLGWSDFEGTSCYNSTSCDSSGITMPVLTYTHSSGAGCSVTGGYVVRGSALPALDGVYLYADYCTGNLWATSEAGDWQVADPIQTGLAVSSFGMGPNGEIYVVDLHGGIYQLVAS